MAHPPSPHLAVPVLWSALTSFRSSVATLLPLPCPLIANLPPPSPSPPSVPPFPPTPSPLSHRQSAPGLIIIAGAFTVAGSLVKLTHWGLMDRPRQIRRDKFTFKMERRDYDAKEVKNGERVGGDPHSPDAFAWQARTFFFF